MKWSERELERCMNDIACRTVQDTCSSSHGQMQQLFAKAMSLPEKEKEGLCVLLESFIHQGKEVEKPSQVTEKNVRKELMDTLALERNPRQRTFAV